MAIWFAEKHQAKIFQSRFVAVRSLSIAIPFDLCMHACMRVMHGCLLVCIHQSCNANCSHGWFDSNSSRRCSHGCWFCCVLKLKCCYVALCGIETLIGWLDIKLYVRALAMHICERLELANHFHLLILCISMQKSLRRMALSSFKNCQWNSQNRHKIIFIFALKITELIALLPFLLRFLQFYWNFSI